MKTITSRTNPEIKQIASLQHEKHRKQYKQFIAEGVRVVSELLQSKIKPIAVYTTESMLPKTEKFAPKKLIVLVPDHVMEKISCLDTPSGIVGVFEIPSPFPSITAPGIVMARIANPGNMGTLIRSAVAMNAKTVIILEGCDPWSPKVVQSSAGTIGNAAINQLSWKKLLAQKPNLCALVVSGGKKPDEINLKNQLLIIGSEARGIPQEWLDDCQEKLTLQMPGKTESLNAAVAGSIALYLLMNRR